MTSRSDFDHLYQLLPFYVNGTLSEADRSLIDTALAQSAELREALAEERQLKARIVAGIDAATQSAPEHASAREAVLKARVSASEQPARRDSDTSAQSRFAKALAFLSPGNWYPAVTLGLAIALPVQAAVIAGQSSQIGWLQNENYRLASGPCNDKPAAGRLLVEVSEDAGFQALANLLDSEGLTIVGMGDFGMLSLQSDKAGTDLAAQLERLRANPLIASADPAA